MEGKLVSPQTVRRLPVYLRYLLARDADNVSAKALAEAFALNEVQVRKDLASVSSRGGRAGVGYEREALIGDIERFLGCDRKRVAVLAGVGNLGRALLGYSGFAQCGMRIRAAFDSDPARVGESVHGVAVYPVEAMAEICRREGARIGIIAVPEGAAREVCARLLDGGTRAIWNFAPAHLDVPADVVLRNENLASSLMVLSKRLQWRAV